MTPLYVAAAKNAFDVAELLIRSGADVNAKENVRSSSFQHLIHHFVRFDNFRTVCDCFMPYGDLFSRILFICISA